MGLFVILSGPSCIGKGPLCAALAKVYPDLYATLRPLTLYNDRTPRPGEVDGAQYHFRSRAEIEALGQQPGFLLIPARADLQALDVSALERALATGQTVFFEGNPYVPARLRAEGILNRVPSLTIYLAPLRRAEILFLKSRRVDLERFVTEVQRRKLLVRTQKQKGILSLPDLEDVEKRAGLAYTELREAWRYDHVIPLHDGEGHEHWDLPFPIGSAGQALTAFAALLKTDPPPVGTAERWEDTLIP